MNRTKKITLKYKAKNKKAKAKNSNKPAYVAKADREPAATEIYVDDSASNHDEN